MRLAIADPPYIGKAEMFYGERAFKSFNAGGNLGHNRDGRGCEASKADVHPDAYLWDDPAQHAEMVGRLVAEYDGWAIAMLPDNLFEYLQWVPRETRIAVWHDPNAMPTGAHPRRRWEAVLVSRPVGRRRVVDVALPVSDVLTTAHASRGFAGAKPRAWTQWVLAMLGYCPTHDTVDDLFAGSGAVADVLNQGSLIECKCMDVAA